MRWVVGVRATPCHPLLLFCPLPWFFFFFFFFFVFLSFLRPLPAAYGGSQARGLIGAVDASLHQSYSNEGSFKPLYWAYTQTCVLVLQRCRQSHCATVGTPISTLYHLFSSFLICFCFLKMEISIIDLYHSSFLYPTR